MAPREPVCERAGDCDGNAACGVDPNGTGLRRCFCKPGFVWDAVAGVCSQSQYLLALFLTEKLKELNY